EYPDGFHGAPADEELLADLAALAAIVELTVDTRAALIDGQLGEPVFPEETQIVRMAASTSSGQAREYEVTATPYDGGNVVGVDGQGGVGGGRRQPQRRSDDRGV